MCALSVGASAPNPDQRTFFKKSFGISKTFVKIKWCVLREVLLPTFSFKKSRKKQNGENRRSEKYILRSYDIGVWLGRHGRDVVFLILFV